MSSIPIKGFSLFLVALAVSLGTFLITLDQFIANVSIPTISGELGVSQNNGAWVITSFTIANAIVVPLVGWLTRLFGRVKFFSYSCILFSLASLLCGLANNFPLLLGFRFLQGLVSGALIPLSQTLLLMLFPPEKKGFSMGLWGLVVMAGPAIGPVLGGWITDNYGWPWIFYINVPIGIIAGLITMAILMPFESKKEKVPIDKLGILLIVMGVCSLQIVLDKGQDLDWINSYIIRALIVTSVISFAFLIPWEIFHPTPVLDLSFFKNRNFTLGTICICLAMLVLFGSFIVYPLSVQAQLGYTPLWAGMTLAPLGVSAMLLFPIVGLIEHKIDMRIWVAIAFIIFAITFFWYSSLSSHPTFGEIAIPRFFQGIAMALFYVPLTTIAISGVPDSKLAGATSLFSFARMLFLSFGISLAVTYWARIQSFYQSRLVEYAIPSNPGFNEYYKILDMAWIKGRHADAFVNQVIVNEAYNFSLLDLSYLAAWIYIFLLFLLFFFRSPKVTQHKKIHT